MRSLLPFLFAFFVWGFAHPVNAGVTFNHYGTACSDVAEEGFYIVKWFRTDITPTGGIYPRCQIFTQDGSYIANGTDVMQADYTNNPGGPAQGEVTAVNPYGGPFNSLNPWVLMPDVSSEPDEWDQWIQCGTATGQCAMSAGPTAAQALCGVIAAVCHVISMPEESPVGMSWVANPANEGDQFAVPFMVANQGDGDWIVFAVDAVEFFRRPMSDFEVDKVYWATVPDGLISSDRPMVWTYWLESAGVTNAHLYVGTDNITYPCSGCGCPSP